MIQICDLPKGCVLWYNGEILGVTGLTLPAKYYSMYCIKVPGNPVDYEYIGGDSKEQSDSKEDLFAKLAKFIEDNLEN